MVSLISRLNNSLPFCLSSSLNNKACLFLGKITFSGNRRKYLKIYSYVKGIWSSKFQRCPFPVSAIYSPSLINSVIVDYVDFFKSEKFHMGSTWVWFLKNWCWASSWKTVIDWAQPNSFPGLPKKCNCHFIFFLTSLPLLWKKVGLGLSSGFLKPKAFVFFLQPLWEVGFFLFLLQSPDLSGLYGFIMVFWTRCAKFRPKQCPH